MPCTKCNSEFTLFNWKIKCGECECKYCNKCLKRKDGVLYCEVCLILIKRPPDHVKLMKLKPKDLRDYLNKNNVSTYGMVEKKELVDLMCNKYIPEKQRKGVDKLTANFGDPFEPLNDLFTNIESVVTARAPAEPSRPTAGSSTSTPLHRTAAQPPTAPPPPPAPEDLQQPTTSREFTPEPSPNQQHLPKLNDFTDIDELSELTAKQLKILLSVNRVEYRGCIEKGELLERARQLWVDSNKNKNQVDDLPMDELCKLCMDAPLDCVLLECGHITSCIECGKKLAECPICRRYVVRVVRTFKA